MSLTMSSPSLPHYQHNHQQQQQYQRYTPLLSSPLAPRPHFENQLPPSPPISPLKFTLPSSSPPQTPASAPPANRRFKPNPLKQTREAAREQRRQLFLDKVRENREEKRFRERGGEDEILRLMHFSEENRRLRMLELEARREAQGLRPEMEEELFDEEDVDWETEAILEQEQQELDEILEHFTGAQEQQDEEDYGMNDLDDVMMCDYSGEGSYPCPCGPNAAFIDVQGECVCFNCGFTMQAS